MHSVTDRQTDRQTDERQDDANSQLCKFAFIILLFSINQSGFISTSLLLCKQYDRLKITKSVILYCLCYYQ